MTETERKALALVNEALGLNSTLFIRAQSGIHEALCRAIEQHEAFRQEVSDAVEALLEMPRCDPDEIDLVAEYLDCFIIAKPDPLVEVLKDAGLDPRYDTRIRAAIEKRGGKIVWGEG